MTTNPQTQPNNSEVVLHMAIELSSTKWKLGFADQFGRKPRVRTIDAGDLSQLQTEITSCKRIFRLDPNTPVVSCYEAGRDGFSVHRCLVALGIENHIVEPSSIQTNRKKRRAKTDRIDVQMIVSALIRFKAGDRFACRMIRIPDAEAEDARNLNREMRSIKNDKTKHSNRIKSLLAAQGITSVQIDRKFEAFADQVKTADGNLLRPRLRERLKREFQRLALAVDHIRTLEMQQAEMLRAAAKEIGEVEQAERKSNRLAEVAYQLHELVGIGPVTSCTLAAELFSWRDIKNRRQLGALAGLTPTPHASGNEEREQGISKSGRGELRILMIEIAWGWLKFQPQSALARWYQTNFGDGTKRSRKRGIVALARKLLVGLGKYVQTGEIPEGATFSEKQKFNYTPSLRPRAVAVRAAA